MCTYLTEKIAIDGSGKGAIGWFGFKQATVYVDHPVHVQLTHSVNIDFTDTERGPSARVALEMSEESALALIEAIQRAIASAPAGLASAK
jgi:hypothetical protein